MSARRRVVRVSEETLARLRAYAEPLGISVEDLAERAIANQCPAIAGPALAAAVEAEDLLGVPPRRDTARRR